MGQHPQQKLGQYSVPLGSILGPHLFVLYTADMFQTAGELGFFIHKYTNL